jgi:hypothetical protein
LFINSFDRYGGISASAAGNPFKYGDGVDQGAVKVGWVPDFGDIMQVERKEYGKEIFKWGITCYES